MNAVYQVLGIVLLQRLAATLVPGLEARALGWLIQLLPIAFTFRIRANHEAAVLLCLLAALYGTERARRERRLALLIVAGLVGLLLVKGLLAVFGPALCVLWLVTRRLASGERADVGSRGLARHRGGRRRPWPRPPRSTSSSIARPPASRSGPSTRRASSGSRRRPARPRACRRASSTTSSGTSGAWSGLPSPGACSCSWPSGAASLASGSQHAGCTTRRRRARGRALHGRGGRALRGALQPVRPSRRPLRLPRLLRRGGRGRCRGAAARAAAAPARREARPALGARRRLGRWRSRPTCSPDAWAYPR